MVSVHGWESESVSQEPKKWVKLLDGTLPKLRLASDVFNLILLKIYINIFEKKQHEPNIKSFIEQKKTICRMVSNKISFIESKAFVNITV